MSDRDPVQEFFEARRAYGLFCAEHNLVVQDWDARPTGGIIEDEAINTKAWELAMRWGELKKKLSPEDQAKYSKVQELCQAIGHFRQKNKVGHVRFVCLTCCCMFDVDPLDRETLNLPGGIGTPMPGAVR